MGGEGGSAQDDEVADRARDDGDDGARLEGMDHELEVEECGQVLEWIPAQLG